MTALVITNKSGNPFAILIEPLPNVHTFNIFTHFDFARVYLTYDYEVNFEINFENPLSLITDNKNGSKK